MYRVQCVTCSQNTIVPFPYSIFPYSIFPFQILVEDLFGVPAEEREAGDAVARIPESKHPQSGNSYCIMAQFLSPRLLPQLLTPVKEVNPISCMRFVVPVLFFVDT